MSLAKNRLKELDKGKVAGVDKSSGKKKKKEKTLSKRAVYSITMTNFFGHLFELILMINNINESEYLDSKLGMQKRNIKLNKKFKRLSSLNWHMASEPGSVDFNGKMVTIYLFHIIYEIDRLIQRTYAKQYHDEKRFKVYNMLLNNIIERTDLIVVGLLTRDFSYSEPLHAMTQMMILASGKDGNILKVVDESFKFLDKECGNQTVDSGVIMNNIMKTAYILATMNLKLKKTPEFIDGDYSSDDVLMRKQIAQLGYAIMKAEAKGASSFFYDIMIEAKPKIYCRWADVNEYPELCVGCQALYLLMIYMDNPDVTRWVNKMIA